MSFTYSKDPSTSKLDECRFLLSDTDESNIILQDEEINFIISEANGNDNLLKYMLFSQATTVFSRAIKRSLGPQSEDPTDRLKYFQSKAAEYKQKVYSGGISIPKYNYAKVFHKGMHNNPPHVGGGTCVR